MRDATLACRRHAARQAFVARTSSCRCCHLQRNTSATSHSLAPNLALLTAKTVGVRRTHVCARRRTDEDYADVSLDGEDELHNQQDSFLKVAQGGLKAANGFADGVAQFIYQFLPESTPMPVVNTSVKAGLVLASLAIIKSLLSLVVTVGFVVLGLYVALRVFNLGSTDSSTAATSSSTKERRSSRRKGSNGDVIDVWFETKKDRSNK